MSACPRPVVRAAAIAVLVVVLAPVMVEMCHHAELCSIKVNIIVLSI
jgi:hypothetical protein